MLRERITTGVLVFAIGICFTVLMNCYYKSILKLNNFQIDRSVSRDKYPDPVCRTNFQNVYSMNLSSWRKNVKVCKKCQNFTKATLNTPIGKTSISVYESSEDKWVSGLLINSGNFEREKLNIMFNLLKADAMINLIDIGANIGVYSLSAAKMGRKVLAVEALDKNIQHMCASVTDNGLQNNMVLVYNAISNNNNIVKLGIHRHNKGGTFVDVDSDHIRELKREFTQASYGTVNAIKIDDLLKLPIIEHFSKVVIKMDIEGFEAKALEGASLLFHKIKIVGIIMEWEFHRGQKSADLIKDFMTKENFVPHVLSEQKRRLNLKQSDSWGYDVLWLPKVA